MCSIIAGLTALSGIASAVGTYQAGSAQAAAYEAQAKAAEQNAQIETRRQEQIADKYAKEGEKLQSRQRLIEGQQRAQAGSAGLAMAGSTMDILSAGQDAYTDDKMTLLSNQRNDNYNSRVAQTNYLNEASAARAAASNAKSQAGLAAFGTILGTAGSIYGMGSTGGGGGGGGNTSSVSSDMGHGTTATFTSGKGYSMNGGWKSSWSTPRTFFGSSKNTPYKRGNYF